MLVSLGWHRVPPPTGSRKTRPTPNEESGKSRPRARETWLTRWVSGVGTASFLGIGQEQLKYTSIQWVESFANYYSVVQVC